MTPFMTQTVYFLKRETLKTCSQTSYLGVYLQFFDLPIAQSRVFGGVGVDLTSIQRDVPHAEQTERAGDHQRLHHQRFDLFEEAFAEGVQRVVSGCWSAATKRNVNWRLFRLFNAKNPTGC